MGDSRNKVSSSLIIVPPEYYDPVDRNKIELADGNHKFSSCFGYVRRRGDYSLKTHGGYDYKAPVGTPVIAVQYGEIEQVRFGRNSIEDYYEYKEKEKIYYHKKERFICPLLILYKRGKYEFNQETCKKCSKVFFIKTNSESIIEIIEEGNKKKIEGTMKSVSDDCYGVQVWLKIKKKIIYNHSPFQIVMPDLFPPIVIGAFDTGLYAYYAHLSKFSSKLNTEIMKMYHKAILDVEKYSRLLSAPNRSRLSFSFFDISDISDISNTEVNYNSELSAATLKPFYNPEDYLFTESTIILDTPFKVEAGEIVGCSGCTGNAYNKKDLSDKNGCCEQHLHFECRKGIEKKDKNGDLNQISPNYIVKTPFCIVKVKNNDDTQKIDRDFFAIKKMKDSDWVKKITGIVNRFKTECFEEEWKSYKDRMSKDEFKNSIWSGETGIVTKKWQNFEFINEVSLSKTNDKDELCSKIKVKSLSEEERKWIDFINNERNKFNNRWWNDFNKQHVVNEDTRNQIIAFK